MKYYLAAAISALIASQCAMADSPSTFSNEPVKYKTIPTPVTASSNTPFSDPYYPFQRYFYTSSELPNGLGITAAQTLVTPYRPLRVGVIDGGFFNSVQDIPFVGGYDAVENDDNPFVESDDCDFGHGTAVSAVIGASRNNGVGIAGVADVDIVPVRALDCELGFESDVVKGMHYLLSLQGTPLEVDVINLSLGGEGDCSSEMQEAVDLAASFNIPVIVAAGNEGMEASLSSPANCENVITVGALAYNDNNGESNDIASFSNYGNAVSLSTQGESIIAPNKNDDDIVEVDGTSFSAPLVSGVVAMIKSQMPDADVSSINNILKRTATEYDNESGCDILDCGAGKMNAVAAVTYAHALSGGTRHAQITNVLSEQNCKAASDAYYESTSSSSAYCDTWEFSVNDNVFNTESSNTYRLVPLSSAEGTLYTVNNNTAARYEFGDGRGIIQNIDTEEPLGLQTCEDGRCQEYLLPIKTLISSRPTYCF